MKALINISIAKNMYFLFSRIGACNFLAYKELSQVHHEVGVTGCVWLQSKSQVEPSGKKVTS